MYTTEHTEDDLHTVTTTYPVAMHFPTVHNGWHYTQTVHINTFIPKKQENETTKTIHSRQRSVATTHMHSTFKLNLIRNSE